ncbi:MAG: translocation/assembly module TamB domain-containing protein [Muribaculaceae bacterium]|nr:translocation/assembly module TamB domain-containing protein [Muribaculaceae bacterium]
MKVLYTILRTLLISLLALFIVLPMALFVVVSLPQVQQKLCKVSETELSKLLGTEVNIERVKITPFNHIAVGDVTIKDDYNKDALKVETIAAGIDLYELFNNEKIVITHAAIIGLDARLYKNNPSAPLNIQGIIDHLQPKDKNKPPTQFDLRVNTIVIRESHASFDILSEPSLANRFDKNHIKVSDFNADVYLPQLKNNDFIFNIKRFQIQEHSGINITSLTGDFHITADAIEVDGLSIALNNSSLNFGDINLATNELKEIPLNIALHKGSHINIGDLAPFVPTLKNADQRFNIDFNLNGNLNNLSIKSFSIAHDSKNINISTTGHISGVKHPELMDINLPSLTIKTNANDLSNLLTSINVIKPQVGNKIAQLGNVDLNAQFNGKPIDAHLVGNINSGIGNVDLDVNYKLASNKNALSVHGDVNTSNLNIGQVINPQFGTTTGSCDFEINLGKGYRTIKVESFIDHLDYNNYRYNNINLRGHLIDDEFSTYAEVRDSCLQLELMGSANLNKETPTASVYASIPYFNLHETALSKEYCTIDADIKADIQGFDLNTINGNVNISDINFNNRPEESLHIKEVNLNVQNSNYPQQIKVTSDLLNASIEGSYSFNTLVPSIKAMLNNAFPVILGNESQMAQNNITESITTKPNDFLYNITINSDNEVLSYFNPELRLFSPITINGEMNQSSQRIDLAVYIPYFAKKKKLYESTYLLIDIDKNFDKCQLVAHSEFPTKHGMMPIDISCNGIDNRLDTYINWKINRKERFEGALDLSTLFSRNEDNSLAVNLDINPSQLVFNDSVWTINQAHIEYTDKSITVDNFDARHADQFITLSGKASPSPNDSLCLNLKNVNLDYIFQTLQINQVNIGGDATGTFYARNLFSKQPVAYTPLLKVKGISYNGAVFGDADIVSHWDNDLGAVHIDAEIFQPGIKDSYINCEIYPIKEALDLRFDVTRVDASFLEPFVSAFASNVSGKASGKARLFGPFKDINLEGDVLAENLKLHIDYTNVTYSTTDSVHFRPGLIKMSDITLYDPSGNTATLNGELRHNYFRDAEFEFNITNTKNFLCYDVKESPTDTWFGHINGNGFARIEGKPGVVNINVEMKSAPKSTFTFVISDTQNAYDYNFLTFRDKNNIGKEKTITPIGETPIEVTRFKEQIKKVEEESSSEFNLDIIVDVTPDAQITLVMDPVGGDKIKANGEGQLKLHYGSANEDVKMYGTYEIDKGSYNFTLQDIIIKDFKLRDDSKISFDGDPMAAKLDISAVYPVKASLSDLDQSFLEDKSINNTNVPIDVVFDIKGIMTQPDINYKLEFPSFANSKGDIESKVNSIVSTEDMMKRQCLYLLALNRFYTPEYMTTTSGNELFSVASSTISSQLSSMLGQLSENWTISPNLRSDLGDFSDVEVDVALSSTLLNNRLRLNGNFGYRDKSLNTNQFIGDFDLEYLLTPRGSWRLKAYNRYNDQNYYIKTATTTQGVGIMYRQDFDNIFRSSNSKKSKNIPDSIVVDTTKTIIPATPIDSTAVKEK